MSFVVFRQRKVVPWRPLLTWTRPTKLEENILEFFNTTLFLFVHIALDIHIFIYLLYNNCFSFSLFGIVARSTSLVVFEKHQKLSPFNFYLVCFWKILWICKIGILKFAALFCLFWFAKTRPFYSWHLPKLASFCKQKKLSLNFCVKIVIFGAKIKITLIWKLNVARFARNFVKWDFFSDFQALKASLVRLSWMRGHRQKGCCRNLKVWNEDSGANIRPKTHFSKLLSNYV